MSLALFCDWIEVELSLSCKVSIINFLDIKSAMFSIGIEREPEIAGESGLSQDQIYLAHQ